MAWQDFLNTPGAKEYYIRSEQFLDIDAPKSSKVYRNAYRYLALIATGKRSGQGSPDYKAIVDDAKRLDSITKRPPPSPQQPASGRMPTRLYIPGMSYIRISHEWERRSNFAVDMPDEYGSDERYEDVIRYAKSGRYILAMQEAFSVSGLPLDLARENTGDPNDTFDYYRPDRNARAIPLRRAEDSDVRPVY